MADEASGTDDQWEGESGDDGNFHGSFGRPYWYNYEYGEYSERPYGFVSPPFPPPYPVCESSSAVYTPPRFFPGTLAQSDASSYEVEVNLYIM